MPLAGPVAVFFISPTVIAVFSILFLGETVGPRRWGAIAVGLIGVIVVLRPGSATFELAALLPLAAAFGYAMLHILTRRMGGTERAVTMAMSIQLVFFIVSLGLLAGCGIWETAQKLFEVVKDPDVQVGDDGDQPSLAKATFFSQRNANINALGEGVPINVLMIEMKGESLFNTSEIFEFADDAETALGAEFVGSSEHTVAPGTFLNVPELELNADTKFIGFVGLFANPNGASWRAVHPVEPLGKVYRLSLEIGNRRLSLTAEEE